MLPITKDASIISPNFESGSVHKWSRKPTDFSTGFCFTEDLSTVLIWLHWGPTGNAFFSGYKCIPSRNSTKSAADYSAFPALLLLCSSAVLQIDASPVPELTNRLGLSFLRGRKDTGLCVSIICLKRDETLSNYFSSNPDASNHSDHVYGPVHTWQNFCFLLQSLMRFLGLWVIPCSPPTSSNTNRLFSKSIILGTQPTYLNEASTYYK